MAHIIAPWTSDQVRALNHWQKAGFVHPFTCPRHSDQPLVAEKTGWTCVWCDYKQDWAHDFMLALPINPLEGMGDGKKT